MKRTLALMFVLGIVSALATADDAPLTPRPTPSPTGPSTPPPKQPPAVSASAMPRYLPPARGAPRTRVGAGTRNLAGTKLPELDVLSPEEIGRTLSESPALYWHLSEPTRARIDFTLIDEKSAAPLIERTLRGPFDAGVHRIALSDLGVKLAPGTEYLWYVALVPDPDERSSDVVAGGGVTRVDAAPLQAEIAGARDGEEAFVLARNGIWYDAIDVLSRRIEKSPPDPLAREQRAALLDQVGLERVAAAERAVPAKP